MFEIAFSLFYILS